MVSDLNVGIPGTPYDPAMDIAPLLYKNHMMEAKRRFRAIDRILGAKKPRTFSEEYDNEFMWLQLRMIVELVAFGGITADEARYAALRAEAKDNPNYRRDWKAGDILRRLSKITPHFLPRPVGALLQMSDGTNHFLEGDEEQTLERFVDIYELAGEYLHSPTPFDTEALADYYQRRETARERIRVEVEYLKKVLWNHVKIGLAFDVSVDSPMQPANPDNAWIVYFGKPETEEIQMALAKAEPD